MKYTHLNFITSDNKDALVHVHLSVVKRFSVNGESRDYRLLKFTMMEFLYHIDTIKEYAIENKVYFAAFFLCGCSKKFVIDGKDASEDDDLDVLCDEHWKQDVLGIPAEVYFVK